MNKKLEKRLKEVLKSTILFSIFIEIFNRPVARPFTGFRKEAARCFAKPTMICYAFAAFAVMRTAGKSTCTVYRVVTSHFDLRNNNLYIYYSKNASL